MRDGDSDVRGLSFSDFLFHNMVSISFLICRAIGHVVEISLVYFCYARADYVTEIPIMSDILVNDVTIRWTVMA